MSFWHFNAPFCALPPPDKLFRLQFIFSISEDGCGMAGKIRRAGDEGYGNGMGWDGEGLGEVFSVCLHLLCVCLSEHAVNARVIFSGQEFICFIVNDMGCGGIAG